MKPPKLLDDRPFYQSLFTIAVPIMVQNLISSLVNMADTVMIGRLGTTAIAAVGIGNQVFFLQNIFLFGVCSGGGVFASQFWGKKETAGLRKTAGLCLSMSVIIAGIFTAACALAPEAIVGLYSADPAVVAEGARYLRTVTPCFIPFAVGFAFTIVMRSTERVRLPIVATFISLSLKVLLGVGLIFGIGPLPAMGVVGAATATVIARAVEMLIIVIGSYARKYVFAGSPRELFGFDALFVSRFLRIATPVIVNEMLWSLGITMQNVIFARTGTDAYAAFTIMNTVSQITWVIFIGLGNGCSVLIGKKIGEGDESSARRYASRITAISPAVAAAVALVLVPASRLLPLVFSVTPAVFLITNVMFVILACAYPFRAFNIAMVIGVCRAGGDTLFSVFYDVSVMWLVTLPLAALASFAFGAPAWAVFLCLAAEDPIKMLFGLARLKSGKWLRNVTG